jgi:hypothetical protein
MSGTTVDKAIDKFHSHLDVCEQCRNHPFNLCPTGATLLRNAATLANENEEKGGQDHDTRNGPSKVGGSPAD